MKETKIALVTGANKGIGLEVARQLAAKGFLVFLDARNRELGNRAAAELAKNGATVSFVELKDGRIINVSSSAGSLNEMGTYAPAYSISKAALNAVTVQLAAQFKNIAVNSVCPGWVRTDMGGPGAPLSLQQGADTIVWLATEAPKSLSGKFLRDRKVIAW